MNVILFIAPKNKGYASVVQKFCKLMGWNPFVLDLEKPYKSYEKKIKTLKQIDIIITAGFRDQMIFYAKDLKEKFNNSVVIQLGKPRYENGESIPKKEINHLNIIIDWENIVNKNELPTHTNLISLDYPPSNITKREIQKIYKGSLKDDLVINIGSSLQKVSNKNIYNALDNLLSIRNFKKVYISYNPRTYAERTIEGERIVDVAFSYLKLKKIKVFQITKFEKFLKRLVNKTYISQIGNAQVINDALNISKMLNLERYHILEYFKNENDFEPFIKKLFKEGWVCSHKNLKKSDLSFFVDTMDIMIKKVKKLL